MHFPSLSVVLRRASRCRRLDISLLVIHVVIVAFRCSGSSLRGLYQSAVGRVGRALAGGFLCYRCRVYLPHGPHQQYLAVLRRLRYLQSVIHVPHHSHNVS